MVRIKENNEVHLTRGDSVSFTIELINSNGTTYTMGAEDTLTLSLRNEQLVVLTKEVTATNIIALTPSDTKKLAPAPYRYEVELHSGNNVYTVIEWSLFVIEREVV